MKPRRGQIEILVDILAAIERGHVLKTRIMYSANVTWAPMNRRLEQLEDRDLIAKIIRGRHSMFWVTEKGRRALEAYRILVDVLGLDRSKA